MENHIKTDFFSSLFLFCVVQKNCKKFCIYQLSTKEALQSKNSTYSISKLQLNTKKSSVNFPLPAP